MIEQRSRSRHEHARGGAGQHPRRRRGAKVAFDASRAPNAAFAPPARKRPATAGTTQKRGRVGAAQQASRTRPLSQGFVCRRRPTLPHPTGCSTIGAGGLSFRVRKGTGRTPLRQHHRHHNQLFTKNINSSLRTSTLRLRTLQPPPAAHTGPVEPGVVVCSGSHSGCEHEKPERTTHTHFVWVWF